jgi:hypothetical protein
MGAWGTGGLPVFLHPGEVKFVPDSALEEEEFKPSVPRGTMSEYRGSRWRRLALASTSRRLLASCGALHIDRLRCQVHPLIGFTV